MQILKTIGKVLLLFLSILIVFVSPAAFTPAVFLSFAMLLVAGAIGAYGQVYFAMILIGLSLLAIVLSPLFEVISSHLSYALAALGIFIVGCAGVVLGMYRSRRHVPIT
jgi:hypothetical protein